MARRANHEGSVYQRTDGQWVASIQVAGKRLYKYGKSRAEASKKLQAILREHHHGTLAAPTRVTLDDWVAQWLSEAKLRPSSEDTYRQVLAPILKELGSIRLDKLTALVLSMTLTKLSQAGMGARRLQLGHGYLKSCLGRAVDLELIGRNPMARVRRPDWTPKPRTYWTPEQTVQFMETCSASRLRWAPLFTVLVTCGLRVSEALGLCGSDLDLTGRKLHVRRAMVWSDGVFTEGPVKSRSAVRSLSLMAGAVEAFQAFGLPDEPESPVFRTAKGEPPSPSQLQRPLKALCKAAGVPYVNVHGTRHIHAALVYRSTKDVYAVQARLGHSDVSFSMRQYGYGTSTDAQTGAALDKLLSDTSAEGATPQL